MASYIFTSCYEGIDNTYTQLLSLISAHPSFKSKVNTFLQFFYPSMSSQDLIKMGQLIYTVLLPDFPHHLRRKLANQQFQSLQTHSDTITYSNLSEYLLKICSDSIENIDVRSAIGFLEMLESRIVDYYVVDAEDENVKKKIGIDIKLQIFDPEVIISETCLPQKKHRVAGEQLYYEERISFTESFENQLKSTNVLVKKLKEKYEDIIPLGFINQQFCSEFINNNFESKNSYRLKGNKNIKVEGKIDYWISLSQTVSNIIRDNVVNQQIYNSCFVLSSAHLPQNISPEASKNYTIYRMNQNFGKPNHYQKLKEQNTGQSKFFNILSQFYERNEFNIDELNLTREKVIVRRKEQLLDIAGKQTVKKEEKDFEDEIRKISFKINDKKQQYTDQKRLQENIKNLKNSLRIVLEEDKNIHTIMNKNFSAEQNLPKDSCDPFKEDVINIAKKQPLQIMILGRAKSGKTTLAKAIAKYYSLVYISIESMIDKVVERSNFFKENPPEADEDGNVKGGLLKIQQCILQDLENGKAVEEEDILDLINIELKKQFTRSRGFILDLPVEYGDFWMKAVICNKVYTPKIGCRFFNRIIEVQQTQAEWEYFTKGIMQKPEDLLVTSQLDRYLITKPPPPPEQQDGQPPEQGEKPTPLLESNLIKVSWKENLIPVIEHITNQMNPLHHLKVKNAFQSVEECLNNIALCLYKIPLPKKLEGSEKQLLTVGLDEQKIARKWSPWGLIDPVQLYNGKLLQGKFQFAADYAGRVFVFENQNNYNSFMDNPRIYLAKNPQLPLKTNICINGPRKSGKKTIAKLLSEIYKYRVIDLQQILQEVMLKQKSLQSHIPSNPDRTSKAVHLSEGQFKQFSKGNMINAKDVLPIILFELGIAMEKKPPGWGIEKNDDEGGEEQAQEKKPPPKKAKKKDKKDEDERPKTPPLQDLSLKEIIPEINHHGKLDEIKGFIIIGYPNNEQQLAALKSFNIPIDKMIILSDNSEENPNKTLAKRLNDAELEQVATFQTNIGPVKQALGEQICKQINLSQTPDEIVNKIRQLIDPFYLKCDQDSLNRVCADKQEDGDPIPMGYCGQYCPITLTDGWLVKGKEEFEAGIEGKRFKFSGQKQLNTFKQNPIMYMNKENLVVPPRIMFMGVRGVGLRTQLKKFNQIYKIPILNLKDSLLQHLENEKNKRKTERYYGKGFKIPEFDEDGKQVEDPELNDEGAEFDKGAVEVQTAKKVFNGISEIFINGNYFDVDEEAVSTPIVQLLAQSRRLPQVVFMLSCDENKWIDRVLDKKQIERELEEMKEKRREEKRKQREEAKQKAIQQGEQYQEPPPEEDEQDPEIPKLQDLIAQKGDSLKEQRNNDQAKLDELEEQFAGWNVKVIKISCERDQKHVADKISSSLVPYMEDRVNRWQRNNMLPIQRHRVSDFINNYVAIESRFGDQNPFTFMKPVLSYPIVYNERIYYLKDQEEREAVMRNPKSLQMNEAVPQDIKIVPTVSVVGLTKTGKTTLAQSLSKRLGLVIVSVQKIIQEFCQQHHDAKVQQILKYAKTGKSLTDEMLVQLIAKRLAISDCQKNGWILDGFPTNKNQCNLLNRHGLLPTNVFSLKLTQMQIKKRVLAKSKGMLIPSYDYDIDVVNSRIMRNREHLHEIQVYFATRYNNLKMLDGKKSKWGLFETTKKQIQVKVKARKSLVRALTTHSPASVSDVGLHFNCIVNNLSDYRNWCPISYKIRRQYIKKCPKHHSNLALYNKKIYAFASQKQISDFLINADTYTKRPKNFSPPIQIEEQKISEAFLKAENKGYCVVELSRNKLVKGNSAYTMKYKDKVYVLSSPNAMKMFIKNPAMYELAKLQDKLPVQFEKKSDLKKIARKNDCTAFLEHHLSNIMMKCLAQLGYRRPKYPTLGSKESALKFLSVSLKANNPNKDEEYRQKYKEMLKKFIKESNYSQEIREEIDRKNKGKWEQYDEENFLKLCEEYNEFLNILNSTDKTKYFSEFIR